MESPVRQTVDRYLLAMRNGDRDAALSLVRPTGVRFSVGGTRLGGLLPRPSSRDRSKISYFVRQVEILRPDVALAIGLWRDANPGAVHRSGAFSYTLVQEGGVWKIATVHETLGQPIPSLEGIPGEVSVARDPEWETLFDGKNPDHWLTMLGGRNLGLSWRVADGSLVSIADSPGADLRSIREYKTFELRWEWMAAKASNSGIKYRLFGTDLINFGSPRFAAGWEYQMADDAGDPGARVDDRQKSGALYGIVPVSKANAKPAGQWNESRLLVAEDHAEHWLNDIMTAMYPIDVLFDSPVVLQHHSSEVRIRNIKIRRLGK